MNKWFIFFLFITFTACGSKKNKAKEDDYFPVVSYLKSQVSSVDSTLNAIQKIETINGISDTVYIKREEFRNHAKEFLALPDLSSEDLEDKYTETELFDPELEAVVLNYTPKKTSAPIQRQAVIIQPNPETGDKVKTIYIDQLLSNSSVTTQKRFTWEVEHYCQAVSIVQKNGAPDSVHILRLTWNPNP